MRLRKASTIHYLCKQIDKRTKRRVEDMSLQTIINTYRSAAYTAGLSIGNTLVDYIEGINPIRNDPAYPAIILIPPKIPIAVNGANYRATINLFMLKKTDNPTNDTGEIQWPLLEALAKTWCEAVTTQKALMRIRDVRIEFLTPGVSIENAWSVRLEVDIEVQCQSNNI